MEDDNVKTLGQNNKKKPCTLKQAVYLVVLSQTVENIITENDSIEPYIFNFLKTLHIDFKYVLYSLLSYCIKLTIFFLLSGHKGLNRLKRTEIMLNKNREFWRNVFKAECIQCLPHSTFLAMLLTVIIILFFQVKNSQMSK